MFNSTIVCCHIWTYSLTYLLVFFMSDVITLNTVTLEKNKIIWPILCMSTYYTDSKTQTYFLIPYMIKKAQTYFFFILYTVQKTQTYFLIHVGYCRVKIIHSHLSIKIFLPLSRSTISYWYRLLFAKHNWLINWPSIFKHFVGYNFRYDIRTDVEPYQRTSCNA